MDYGPEKTGQDYGEWYDSEKEEQPTAPAQQHEIDTDFVAGPIPLVLQPPAKTGSDNAIYLTVIWKDYFEKFNENSIATNMLTYNEG